MDFFEKLSKKASETYKSAAEKTNKIAAETKLKIKMNDNKSKINEIYKEIGKKVYEKYALDGTLDIKSDIENELGRIKELADEIVGFEKQMLDLSDMKTCVQCGNKMEKGAKFCPECGATQPEEVKEVKEAEVVSEENTEDVKEQVNNAVDGALNNTEVPEAEEPTETAKEINPNENSEEFVEKLVEESPNEPQE